MKGAIFSAPWLIAVILAMSPFPAHAQTAAPPNAGLDQKLNAQAPLNLTFRDETGAAVRLGNYFGSKPVILVLAYYECPNLCTLVLNAMLASVQDLKFDVGKDFEIVVVSFNPRETPTLAAQKRKAYTQRYGRPQDNGGWHFLTGDEPAIVQLAQSVGFRFAWDAQAQQYAHPSAIMVLTPEGKVSRYFAGIEYPPKELRLALVEASERRIGSLTDRVFLLCFHYNPLTGKYGLAIMRVMRVAGFATVAALAIFMGAMFRRDRRRLKQTEAG
jgi:protein SCO1/2